MAAKSVFGKQLGFTLIEMLIAVAIGAAISVMAYTSLAGAIRADERVKQVVREIDEVDRVWQYLGNDLLFALPRPWVNALGTTKAPMLGVDGDILSQSDVIIAGEEDYLLQFIRGNRENLLNRPQSNLYMVGFRLTQADDSELKSLWRDSWTPVDGSTEPKMQQRLLATGIEEIRFEYLPATFQEYNDQAWLSGWPPSRPAGSISLPAAVKVRINLASLGETERVFTLSMAK
ncbi:MAG: general secretion pathway protein J [Cellvibrionaceae bacterium]|jgi:general secretion pathway protein J